MVRKIKIERIYVKPVTFGGPTKKGSNYYNFKKTIISNLKFNETLEGELSIRITLFILRRRIGYNKNDLDNFLKPIIDALDESRLLSEENIAHIDIKREVVHTDNEEGIEIEISNI